MTSAIRRRALGLLLAAAAGAGEAGEQSSTFTGTIVSSADRAGSAGFGAGSGVLDGLAVRVVVALDASRAPPDADPSPAVGHYVTHESASSWLRIERVEVAGRRLPLPRLEGSVTHDDADQRVLVTAYGDVQVFVDLDWHDARTGAFLDQALRIGLDGAARADDSLVPLIGPGARVTGTGSYAVQRIEPGGVPGAYLGFDFRVTGAASGAAPLTP